jgi:hypothetical protein
MKITKKQALMLAKKLDINLKVISLEVFQQGLNVELEHGSKLSSKLHKNLNVTHDNLLITAKIATAHLTEFPNYYQKLKKLEDNLDKYWAKRTKPNIFN